MTLANLNRFYPRFLVFMALFVSGFISARDLKTLLNRGVEQYQAGQYAGAARQFQQILDQSENNLTSKQQEQVSFNLASSYAQQEQWQPALKHFEQVVVLNHRHQRALKNIKIIKKLLEKEQEQKQEQEKQQNQDKQDQQKDQERNQQEQKDNQQQENQKQKQDQKQQDQQKDQKQQKNNQQSEQQDQSKSQKDQAQSKLDQTEQNYLQAVQELDRRVRSESLRQAHLMEKAKLGEVEHEW